MKTKNTILGILAIALATGSAFAEHLSSQTAYVKVRLVEDGPIQCFNTKITCNDPGQFACRIQLLVATGSNTTSKTYRNGCSMPLTTTSQPLVVTAQEVYELTDF